MHITFGGIVFLICIALVIIGIIWFRSWRSGSNINWSFWKREKKEKPDADSILCFNIYPDKYKVEKMLKKSVCKDAEIIKIGNTQYVMQGWNGKEFLAVHEPEDIIYQPERLARMMGCEPLRRLKSLKFSKWEQLAPFAPVAALLIAFFLFIIIL